MPLFVTHLIKIIFNYINEELGSNGIFFQGRDIYRPSMWGCSASSAICLFPKFGGGLELYHSHSDEGD